MSEDTVAWLMTCIEIQYTQVPNNTLDLIVETVDLGGTVLAVTSEQQAGLAFIPLVAGDDLQLRISVQSYSSSNCDPFCVITLLQIAYSDICGECQLSNVFSRFMISFAMTGDN